jgi:hypothetical protein
MVRNGIGARSGNALFGKFAGGGMQDGRAALFRLTTGAHARMIALRHH